MLRRLRQPENLALIIAVAALVIAGIYFLISMTEGWLNATPNLSLPIPYIPLFFVASTSLLLSGIIALSLLITLISMSFNLPQGERRYASIVGWIGIPVSFLLCSAANPIGCGAGLFTIWLFLYAMIERHIRYLITSVLLSIALAVAGMVALGNEFSRIEHIQTLNTNDHQYALATITISGSSDICVYDRFVVLECDSLLLVCHKLWQSDIYCHSRRSPVPEHRELMLDADSQHLIVQLDDETFEIPVDP